MLEPPAHASPAIAVLPCLNLCNGYTSARCRRRSLATPLTFFACQRFLLHTRPMAPADNGVDRAGSSQAAPLAVCLLLPIQTPRLPVFTGADNGVDRVVSAQAALTRDTTYLVNGAQVGARDIFTVSSSCAGLPCPASVYCLLRALHCYVYCVAGCVSLAAAAGHWATAALCVHTCKHMPAPMPPLRMRTPLSIAREGPRAAVSPQLQTQKLC